MKKGAFIAIFVGTHIAFVFVQIHQYSQVIKYSYQKQKNETLKNTLVQKKQALTHQIYALQNRTAVKQFATNTLKMEPIHLNQIKKINTHVDQQTV